MRIAILVTGGTFDKEYNEIEGALCFRNTHIEEMLAMGRCGLSTRIQAVLMKDSMDITEEDRTEIINACRSCEESRIVITHGTDAMEQTAKLLADAVCDKTVILTGAMIPYAFGRSDGLFNLGSALSFAQSLPNGVYVSMNGCLFDAHDVFKDKQRGIFRSKKDL
jgi:L-asparaginase